MLYCHRANVFNPEGRILQLEYATEATKRGPTSLGVCTQAGLVLIAERRPASSLMVAGALDRIVKLDDHLYCAYAGMAADVRSLIRPAQVACATHRVNYNEPIPIDTVMGNVAEQMMTFGMGDMDGDDDDFSDSGSNVSSSGDTNAESDLENRQLFSTCRPYGAALLVAGFDNDLLELFHTSPTADFKKHGVKAIGSGCEAAERLLDLHYSCEMDASQVMDLALSAMKLALGGRKLSPCNLEVMLMKPGPQCHKFNEKELEEEIKRIQDSGEWFQDI